MRPQMMTNILNCAKCKLFEKREPKLQLCNIKASEPLDPILVNLVRFEKTVNMRAKPVIEKCLVIVDHFSRYIQAYKVVDKRAITIAKCLHDNYFRHFGFPHRLLSDQGKEFCSSILAELCYYLNIKKVHTTPYHPQTNGAVEHVHQTLHCMIGKLDSKHRRNWPDHIESITHVYNATRSQITRYSPYFLMFGCRPWLPIDLLFLTSRQLPCTKGVNKYIKAPHKHL